MLVYTGVAQAGILADVLGENHRYRSNKIDGRAARVINASDQSLGNLFILQADNRSLSGLQPVINKSDLI